MRYDRSMNTHRVIIVGGGFSGVAVAATLRRAGIDDFVILEKGSQFGGTWRDNTYPGCACDVPSALYSLSFAPNPEWSHTYARQPEIQQYLLRVVREEGLPEKTVFNSEMTDARWDEDSARWVVQAGGQTYQAPFLVGATGPLFHPRLPRLPGMDDFAGTQFHSSKWQADADLSGRVAVVGTGSSAIQIVPEIQPRCGHLTLFQRTPGWVLPKWDRSIAGWEKWLMRTLPGLTTLRRLRTYLTLETLQFAQRRPKVMALIQHLGLRHLRRQVSNPEMRQALTPNFVLSCKRLLLSDTYYPALQADNARFVSRAVASVVADGILDTEGEHHPVDTLIWATGFDVNHPPVARHIYNAAGQALSDIWQDCPSAYRGTTVPGFPNLFVILGPNTGNGHTSVLIAAEAQARYLTQAIQHLERTGKRALDPTTEAHDAWNHAVHTALEPTVWQSGGCASWYQDGTGKNHTIYPWSTLDLMNQLRQFQAVDYTIR